MVEQLKDKELGLSKDCNSFNDTSKFKYFMSSDVVACFGEIKRVE